MWIKRQTGKYFLWYNCLLNGFPWAVVWLAGKIWLVDILIVICCSLQLLDLVKMFKRWHCKLDHWNDLSLKLTLFWSVMVVDVLNLEVLGDSIYS